MSNLTMFTIFGVVFAIQAAISIRWGGKIAVLAVAAPYMMVFVLFAVTFGYFSLRGGFRSVLPKVGEGITVALALCGFWTPFGALAACIGLGGRAKIRNARSGGQNKPATRN